MSMSYGKYDPDDDPKNPPLLPDNTALRMIGSAFLGLFVLAGIGCVIALIIAAITAS